MTLDPSIHLLLVDDEPSIREPLTDYLIGQGFAVDAVADAAAARVRLAHGGVDLVIADIMMPGEDGLSLTRHIRATSAVPVILLTARTDETERIVGLEIGADDYLGKPFNPRELVARIRAVLRRAGSEATGAVAADADGPVYHFGPWRFLPDHQRLLATDGTPTDLTTGESRLLLALVNHPHRVMSRDRLLDLVRGRDADLFDRAIDNLVSRLRRKVDRDSAVPGLIRTVWGGGYTLAADVRRSGEVARHDAGAPR